jgi:hypothetical protein
VIVLRTDRDGSVVLRARRTGEVDAEGQARAAGAP